jgi:hypothetical protein
MQDPKLEKGCLVSSDLVAPTVMTSTAEAGDSSRIDPFPPAAPTTTPAARIITAPMVRDRT